MSLWDTENGDLEIEEDGCPFWMCSGCPVGIQAEAAVLQLGVLGVAVG